MQTLIKLDPGYTGAPAEANVNGDKQRNMLMAFGNPGYMETRRRGEGWNVLSAAFTSIVAAPTTAAALEVYNNGFRLIVVSDLHIFMLSTTAATDGASIWAMITTLKAIPTKADLVLYSMSGKASITTTVNSEVGTGAGTTVIANGWMPYGNPVGVTASADPCRGYSVPIDGKLIVPPGCSLCLHATDNTGGASGCHVGVTFDIISATVEV